MIGTRVIHLSPDDLRLRAEASREAGGRLQFAYAVFPPGRDQRSATFRRFLIKKISTCGS